MFASLRKFALVIGNGAYQGRDRLESSPQDAKRMAEELEQVGFEVKKKTDLDVAGMNACVDEVVADLARMPAGVGLFYYSGHGVQVDGKNYLAPIGFETIVPPREDALVELQGIIDKLSKDCATRLVFLDACRSSFKVEEFSKTLTLAKSMARPDFDPKSFAVGGKPVSGLASMRSMADTFIAFAAAPGQIAFASEKGGPSPFTESVIDHLGAVDLPLDTLMTRVHNDVFKTTEERQSPWANSSLGAPFFFNPSSSAFLMSNFMALLGLIGATSIFALTLQGEFGWARVTLAAALVVASLAVLIFGAQRAYSRLEGLRQDEAANIRNHLHYSLSKGALGGFLGGLIAAFPIGIEYWLAWKALATASI